MQGSEDEVKIGRIKNGLDVAVDEIALIIGLDAQQDGAGSVILRFADEGKVGVEFLARHADGRMGVVGEGDVVGAGDFGDASSGGGAGVVDGIAAGMAAEVRVGMVIGWQGNVHRRRNRTPGGAACQSAGPLFRPGRR